MTVSAYRVMMRFDRMLRSIGDRADMGMWCGMRSILFSA